MYALCAMFRKLVKEFKHSSFRVVDRMISAL